MRQIVRVVALLALLAPAIAQAAPRCAPSSVAEAEQAIRYLTALMVASSACRNTVYAEFALRNRVQIIRYQRAMIAHLHGTAAFDRWDTRLANEAAQRQSAVSPAQFCRDAEPMLQQAASLDVKGLRAFAAARAAAADPAPRCRR